MTIFGILHVLVSIFDDHRHPLFSCPNDHKEREAMASEWHRDQVTKSLRILPFFILMDILIMFICLAFST